MDKNKNKVSGVYVCQRHLSRRGRRTAKAVGTWRERRLASAGVGGCARLRNPESDLFGSLATVPPPKGQISVIQLHIPRRPSRRGDRHIRPRENARPIG